MEDMMQIMLKLGDLLQHLEQIGKSFLIVVAVLGLLNCFLGYKLLRLWVTVVGLAVGGIGGLLAGYRFLHAAPIVSVIIAGVAALILAGVAFYIYKAGIFLLCAGVGLAICIYVIHPRSSVVFFICLLVSVGIGALGVVFVKPIVIVTTSIQGGLAAGAAIVPLLQLGDTFSGRFLGIGIAVLGLIFQVLTNLHSDDDKDDEDEDDDQELGRRQRKRKEQDERIEQW